MSKVYLAFIGAGHEDETPGKRTPYIKSLGRQVREYEFNNPVATAIRAELKRCGVHVYDPAPTDNDSLKERTDRANKIYWQHCSKYGEENVEAIYVSIHFNAYDGSFSGPNPGGFSVHIYPGSKGGRKLAENIISELKNGTKQNNRSIKENNFHVVRETEMYAALTENGFMDNPDEALLMLNKDFQKEVAIEHAKGICKYFEIPYIPEPKPQPKNNVFYRVVTGSFKDMDNAERRVKELKEKGFDSFIDVIKEGE